MDSLQAITAKCLKLHLSVTEKNEHISFHFFRFSLGALATGFLFFSLWLISPQTTGRSNMFLPSHATYMMDG